MSDIKISALPGASTLTGAETIPLVQGGTTKKVTTDQFLIKDGSGNVGVGVTPSGNFTLQAKSSFTDGFKGFSLGGFCGGASGSGYPWVGYNIRPTSTSDAYVYDVGDVVSAIKFADGISFYVAPSGTAGNPISFTQSMGLNASGVLTLTPSINQALVQNASGGAYSTWQIAGASVGDVGTANQLVSGGSSADFAIASRSGALVLGTNSLARARIDASGNLLVGTTSAVEKLTLTGRAFLADQAAPATPTGGGVIYVEAGALKYKGSSGTVTTLAPA